MFSTRVLCHNIIIFLFAAVTSVSLYGQTVEFDTSGYIHSNSRDAIDFNLLVAASKGYDSEIVRLLGLDADINTTSDEGATPLVYAVANNRLSTVRVLLSHYPEADKKTGNNETPLIIAVKQQNLEIAEALVRGGADINMSDSNGATPLHYATISGSFYITDMLLYYNAEKDSKSYDGTTPLMAAIYSGYVEIADLLVQNGANMEARDKGGFTPFLTAAQNGDTLLMDLLLEKGVDLYEKNNRNYNALDIAIAENNTTAVEFLLRKGDKWTSPDKAGADPYEVSAGYNRKNLIKLLRKENISGKSPRKISESEVWAGEKFNFRDIYSGFSFSFKEPLSNAGIIAGFDTKIWYTRVLVKKNENLFYQFYDRNSIVYAGLFRDFKLFENYSKAEISLSPALMAAYSFGHKLKGTQDVPPDKFMVIPSFSFKIRKNRFQAIAGIEYMNPDFYGLSPLWFRAGLSYFIHSERITSPQKVINWR